MSLLLNTLSRFVRAFLPRGKHHLISWLQLPCAVILEPKKRKICHCFYFSPIYLPLGFPHSSVGKESPCNAGDPGLIPGSGRSPVEGNGNPLQYSCLENSMDREEPGGLQSMGSQRVRHTTKWLTLSLSYNGVLLTHKKEWNSAKWYNIDETWKTLRQAKDASHKRLNIIGFHL